MCLDVISNGPCDTANTEKLWRRDACLAVRAHLRNHENMTLHPRLRDHTSATVQDARAEDHTLADLEHHPSSRGQSGLHKDQQRHRQHHIKHKKHEEMHGEALLQCRDHQRPTRFYIKQW